MERQYDVYQAAQLLGVKPMEVVDLVQQGLLTVQRQPNGPTRISAASIKQHVKRQGGDLNALRQRLKAIDDAHSQAADGKAAPAEPDRPEHPPAHALDAEPAVGANGGPLSNGAPDGDGLAGRTSAIQTAAVLNGNGHAPAANGTQPHEVDSPLDLNGNGHGNGHGPKAAPAAPVVAPIGQEPPAPAEPEPAVAANVSAGAHQSNGDDMPAVESAEQVVAAVLRDAAVRRAAGVLLETSPQRMTLRLRIDGAMVEKVKFRQRVPVAMGPRIVAHLRLLAGADGGPVARGSFSLPIDGRDVRFDLSACPTAAGQRIAIRVYDPDVAALALAQLGLAAADEAALRAAIAARCGLVVVAAPPRSGKRTTLRAMAAEADLARCDAAVVTRRAWPATQWLSTISPRPADALGFADALGAAVDQETDVLVLDDARDLRSIQAALNAALDGRLVLASMQVPRAADALRLLLTAGNQAGLDRWEMALAIKALISQRTLRKLCPACRAEQAPSQAAMAALGLAAGKIDFPTFAPRGCPQCARTGYAGLTGVFAVAAGDLALADLLRGGAELAEIESALPALGPAALVGAGLAKLRDGTTSLEELALRTQPLARTA
ncbi:MAG: ATPase, T2SS/T4P/T4SS family [Phycisphaerae bacterium]